MAWYDRFTTGKKDKKDKKQKNYSASSFWYDQYDSDWDYADWAPMGSAQSTWFQKAKKSHDLYKLASVRRAIANFVSIVTAKNIPVQFATKNSATDGRTVVLASDIGDKFDISVGLALHEGSHILLSDFKLLAVIGQVTEKCLYQYSIIKDADPKDKNYNKIIEHYNSNMSQIIQSAIQVHNSEVNQTDSDKRELPILRHYDQNEIQMLRRVVLTNGLMKWVMKGYKMDEVFTALKAFTNWIEDRRIDNFIYQTAPGYRDYYKSMYGHYFEDKSISKAIASDEFTEEEMQSYLFRIVNILNENTDLNKLKGLRACVRLLNLNNVGRLNSSWDSLDLAINLVDLIYTTIDAQNQPFQKQGGDDQQDGKDGKEQDKKQDQSQPQSGKGGGQPDKNDAKNDGQDKGGKNEKGGQQQSNQSKSQDDGDDSDDSGQDMSGNGTGDINDVEPTADDGSGNSNKSYLTDKVMKQVKKAFEAQKDFISGELKKKGLSAEEIKTLMDLVESGTELKHVGDGYMDNNGSPNIKGVDCIVVKKVTDKLLTSTEWPYHYREGQYQTQVDKGIKLGILLGNKLQTRSESRETVFNRLKQGKIDGRMVASLGYDNEGVFYSKEVDKFKKANLHISVDYSGSMGGSKLYNSIVLTMAIAKACELARNINVQVSIRSTSEGRGKCLPHIALIYDSKTDGLKRLGKLLAGCSACNTTPEGLCFEAIQDKLMPSETELDSYFLNMSDGEPAFSNSDFRYSGTPAAEHTHIQIRKMQERGINVLSYFINDYEEERAKQTNSWTLFSKSYGPAAKCVKYDNLMMIAKTMNELFMKKGSNK
jgi:hypothetical protein